jgi:transposase IS116/IS110/IS902 family protein
VRARHVIEGLLTQYNVTSLAALPPLVQLRTTILTEQLTLLAQQIKRIEPVLHPQLIPTPDVQRLVWIPGVGKIVAFTLVLEIDDIARFPSARDFVSSCRLVPGAGNSGGKTRHKRTKDGNRYLKLAFRHAAVRAIQYFPEVATAGEPARLTGAPSAQRRADPPPLIGPPAVVSSQTSGTDPRDREPAMVYGRHRGAEWRRCTTPAVAGYTTALGDGRVRISGDIVYALAENLSDNVSWQAHHHSSCHCRANPEM